MNIKLEKYCVRVCTYVCVCVWHCVGVPVVRASVPRWASACVCVHARVRASVCVPVCVCVHACMHVRACTYLAELYNLFGVLKVKVEIMKVQGLYMVLQYLLAYFKSNITICMLLETGEQ